MRIENLDGTISLDLELMRYQFPELENDRWDSNWLIVSGKVITSARSWQFEDPCLTTVEAHALSDWLADIGKGNPTELRIFFTEPNLSFEVVPDQSKTVELKIYFAEELLPQGVDAEYDTFFEVLRVSRDELNTAANELNRALRRFPVR